jgi:hypothetical protein
MQGAAMIEEEERRVRESGGQDYDMLLKNNIEGIIIKWAYQVRLIFRILTIFFHIFEMPTQILRC